MDSIVQVNEAMKLKAPEGSYPRFTVHDLSNAVGKSENMKRSVHRLHPDENGP